jgi:hypothetical protein
MKLTPLLILPALLFSCANPVSPTGGPKDEIPPQIQRITFDTLGTHRKVILLFNENIVSTNDIILNPQKPTEKKPIIEKGTRTLVIPFLQHHTSINIGNAVKDLNEGNIGVYSSIVIRSDDSFNLKKIISLPKYFKDLKNSLTGHFQKDSLYYKGYIKEDTLTIGGLPEKHTPLEIFFDENKNGTYDSTEWGTRITNTIDTFFYPMPPKKIKISIDTTQIHDMVIIPFYRRSDNLPKTNIIALPNDTLIGLNGTFRQWLQTQSSYNPIYKEIKSKPLLYKISAIHSKDTLISYSYSSRCYQLYGNAVDTLTIKDTLKIKKQYGYIHFQNDSNYSNLQLIILKDQHYIYHKSITQNQDSILLEAGEYTFIAFEDKNNNELLDQVNPNEDRIIHYFDMFLVKPGLDNVIKLGTTVKKDTENSGKQPSNTKNPMLFKPGVKQPTFIKD